MNAKERVQASLAHRQPDRVPVDYFQRIVATRNDLGTFASMHNKFVRLAMVRLRLSMGEYLGELPPQVETTFAEAMCPDTEAPARIFLPTRPTLLARESRSASPSSPPARRRKSSSAPAPTAPRAGPPRLRNRSPAATFPIQGRRRERHIDVIPCVELYGHLHERRWRISGENWARIRTAQKWVFIWVKNPATTTAGSKISWTPAAT